MKKFISILGGICLIISVVSALFLIANVRYKWFGVPYYMGDGVKSIKNCIVYIQSLEGVVQTVFYVWAGSSLAAFLASPTLITVLALPMMIFSFFATAGPEGHQLDAGIVGGPETMFASIYVWMSIFVFVIGFALFIFRCYGSKEEQPELA